jgi:hypothetical protein
MDNRARAVYFLIASAARSDHESIYGFSLLAEIGIAAGVLAILLFVARLNEVGYRLWCLYTSRMRDKAVFVALAVVQLAIVVVLAAILPLVHHLLGVRPTSITGLGLLIAEAVVAGWVALQIIPSEVEEQRSLTSVLVFCVRSADQTLTRRAEDCMCARLGMTLLSELTASQTLRNVRRSADVGDRPPVDVLAGRFADAWRSGNQDEIENAITDITDYVRDRRIAPARILTRP